MKHFLPLSLTILFIISGCSKSENSNLPEDSSLEIFIGNYKNSFWKTEEVSKSIPFNLGGPLDTQMVVYYPFSGYFELSLNENNNTVWKASQFWDISDAYDRGHGKIYNNGGPTSNFCESCRVTTEGYFTNCADPSVLYFDDPTSVIALSSDYENILIITKKSKIDDSQQEWRLVIDETSSPKRLTKYADGRLQEVFIESSKPSYCN